MSLKSKIFLWTAVGVSSATIIFVHYKQRADRDKLHEGVIRDIERQQKRKIENIYFLQQQIEMSEILKKQQTQDDAVAFKLLEDTKQKQDGC